MPSGGPVRHSLGEGEIFDIPRPPLPAATIRVSWRHSRMKCRAQSNQIKPNQSKKTSPPPARAKWRVGNWPCFAPGPAFSRLTNLRRCGSVAPPTPIYSTLCGPANNAVRPSRTNLIPAGSANCLRARPHPRGPRRPAAGWPTNIFAAPQPAGPNYSTRPPHLPPKWAATKY